MRRLFLLHCRKFVVFQATPPFSLYLVPIRLEIPPIIKKFDTFPLQSNAIYGIVITVNLVRIGKSGVSAPLFLID